MVITEEKHVLNEFKITQIKILKDRIGEKVWRENGIEMNTGQLMILYYLWQKNHETISEISRQTSLANNTVSIMINGMVKKGLVKRKTNPKDRRQTIVSLTEYGESLRGIYAKMAQQMDNLFYHDFTLEERLAFEEKLDRIIQHLKQFEDTRHE